MKYEAWISDKATVGMKSNRVVTIDAKGVQAAHRVAKTECGEGEFVRGVNESEEGPDDGPSDPRPPHIRPARRHHARNLVTEYEAERILDEQEREAI